MSRTRQGSATKLDELDRAIINRLQDGLPITSDPFAEVARDLDCDPEDLVDRLARLRAGNVVTRFGPFIDTSAMGGAFCLCAMAVPKDRFEDVAAIVNGFHEVAHNYERDHKLNMWFVLATATPDQIEAVAVAIEVETGLAVLLFPKLEEYFIGFKVAA